MKAATACETKRQREWDEKGDIKDYKGMLIKDNYRNVYIGHGHAITWDKQHE
jgi:hypothetical protein